MSNFHFGLMAVSAAALVIGPSHARTIALDAIDRGWYGNGLHTPRNLNYAVGGTNNGGKLRNFFVFDLSTIEGGGRGGKIVGAELRIWNTFFASPDPFETYTLFHVETSAKQVVSTFFSEEIFNDLGGGPMYAHRDIAAADQQSLLVIPLNALALDSLNLASSLWVVGGAFTTLDDNPATVELTFAGSETVPMNMTQLVVTKIPAPPALAAFTLGAIAFRRHRR